MKKCILKIVKSSPRSLQDYEEYYGYEDDDYYEEGEKVSKEEKRFEVILGHDDNSLQAGNGHWADGSSSVKDKLRKKIR